MRIARYRLTVNDLFAGEARDLASRPLADRMRPARLDEFFGQEHLLASGKPLLRAIEDGRAHSMVFWGPPGTGKTTLARLIAAANRMRFVPFSAVLSGIKEVRQVMAAARDERARSGVRTLLFVDEIHRFNKAQQDAFLPFVESGDIVLIGATTENPSFELNSALLSRARTYVLKRLGHEALRGIIDQAITDREQGLGALELQLADEQRDRLAEAANLPAVGADAPAGKALGKVFTPSVVVPSKPYFVGHFALIAATTSYSLSPHHALPIYPAFADYAAYAAYATYAAYAAYAAYSAYAAYAE